VLRDFYNASSFLESPQSSSLFLYVAGTAGSPSVHVKLASLEHMRETLHGTPLWSANAIVGMAANIDTRPLAVFLKSARKAIPSAEIILFMNYPMMTSAVRDKPSTLLNLLQEARAHVVEYREQYLQPPFLRRYHSSSLRWIFYHRLFSNYDALLSKTLRKVIHVDVRDVQFGADPFRHLDEHRVLTDGRLKEKLQRIGRTLLHTKEVLKESAPHCVLNSTRIDMASNQLISSVEKPFPSGCASEPASEIRDAQVVVAFKEEESPQLGDCAWNAGWIRDCFGQALLDTISASPISCSGVVLGTMPAVLDFFRVFADTLQGRGVLSDRFPHCERNGVDQGIHNVLLHAGLVPGVKLHTTLSFPGVVSHMQSDLYASANSDNPPRILDAQGVAVSIVHQYDRIDGLQKRFAQHYVDWMDINDWHAGWASPSSQCSKYKRLVQLDLLKGECDFGSFRALTPDMCCGQCVAKRGCSAFTFAGGVCWFKKCSLSQLASHYANFTMHVALKLPLTKYVAVADEYNTPVDSLVLTALSQDIASQRDAIDPAELLQALRKQYNRLHMPVQIGQRPETQDPQQMLRDYLAFLPLLDENFRRADQQASLSR
jgi:hypothetical protein